MKTDFSTESTSPLLAPTSVRPRANSRGEVRMGLGVVFVFISAFAFSTMSFLASIASRWFASSETMFIRCIMQLIFAWAACRAAKVPVLPSLSAPHHLFWWVMLRGLFGAAGNWILYYSLSQLPLADASSLFFTQPMFTLTLAPILIHEKIAPRQVLAVLFAVCGVFCIAHPAWLFGSSIAGYEAMGNVDAQLPRWLAIIVCLCGSFCSAMVFITVSNIGRRAHWSQLVFAFAIIGTCVATIPLVAQLAPLRWPRGIVPYIVIISVGCCALVGQATFNYGMQLCQSAVTSSLVRQSDLIFAFIYQALFLSHPLTWYVIVGGCFVLGGALTDAVPKVIKELRNKGYLAQKAH
ncbi:Transmembrane protein, putative [Perkinsus marinus ATCC 50983]|uniref:Transmembrane protein, putative n=1 Tax=Perkinsus marinus (strain ATCC 50983 / TXsc) TaxID=423536 RepID=C5KL76_PERM5|nr:Transmembrane protein, putative [Perkinsus marinus ATCC 50983]EER14749.1 Transmembrane protein, putative [Perkinsus marinus ATCC 50983]|eukprot:XP_002782953.1 Transmembrane protein, putative [Perkinsus marinus ATCC 50983]